jgi:hypothetical protein
MNTTRTAQYAALAANNSCRLALVSIDMAVANRSVKTISTPMAEKIDLVVRMDDNRYMLRTGATSKTNITIVMTMLTSRDTREGEK